ncbi:putative bifunctional diguanylate cyclase/phosphodiesterase [Dongia sp.]|uniref:putative bifunctional diguanylate cyclase/phosphodiesterase n=1 Tax=Dongia sp. TaxID=1977262 RepID=UPI0035AE805C
MNGGELILTDQPTSQALLVIAILAIIGLAGTTFLSWRQSRLAWAAKRQAILEAQLLRTSKQRFRQLADATFEGIVIHKDGIIIDVNTALAAMLGYPQEALIGRNLFDVTDPSLHARLAAHLAALRESRDVAFGDGIGETLLLHADGTRIPAEIHARTLPFEGGDARVIAIRDVRERKEAEERIRHLAHHDALTGLPNRNLFRDRLVQVVARAKRTGTTVAVLSLDLDRFRSVNEMGGTEAGDALLREVAVRLTDSIRADDTVARISGDEFAVIQVGVSHPDGPAIMAARLIKAMAQPFALPGHAEPIVVGASLGIALYPSDGEDGDTLMRAADHARARAKEGGRGTYRFCEPEMDRRLQERRALEADLRQALATEQFELYYQPLADCQSTRLQGFEALLRWRHPERGMVSPAEFIPLAEECGLINTLGAWVLRSACRAAAAWPRQIPVAINLSPVQFRQPDLATEILGILKETGLAPERLELEITEGVLISEPERTLATLNALKEAGIRISLDDFGTGYSSLSYLQRFPFDKLKIDHSFIQGMESHSGSMAIVRAVIALGRSLHLTITAEGVETPKQLALLQAQACDQAQGYLLGRPLPGEDAKRLIDEDQPLVRQTQAAE